MGPLYLYLDTVDFVHCPLGPFGLWDPFTFTLTRWTLFTAPKALNGEWDPFTFTLTR